jgi:virginiamycin B lyase
VRGRITITGRVTKSYHVGTAGIGSSIDDPDAITIGPDGALWFTSTGNNTIGRITATRRAASYTGPGISLPSAITAGPEGALRFTNYGDEGGSSSIGRITTNGTVASYASPEIVDPSAITPVPTARCGSPTKATTRSGGSARAGGHQPHRPRHH